MLKGWRLEPSTNWRLNTQKWCFFFIHKTVSSQPKIIFAKCCWNSSQKSQKTRVLYWKFYVRPFMKSKECRSLILVTEQYSLSRCRAIVSNNDWLFAWGVAFHGQSTFLLQVIEGPTTKVKCCGNTTHFTLDETDHPSPFKNVIKTKLSYCLCTQRILTQGLMFRMKLLLSMKMFSRVLERHELILNGNLESWIFTKGQTSRPGRVYNATPNQLLYQISVKRLHTKQYSSTRPLANATGPNLCKYILLRT